MGRRYGIVKTIRDDGQSLYSVAEVLYERDPNNPRTVNLARLSLESTGAWEDEDSVIWMLQAMIRDCQKYPIIEVKSEAEDK